MSQSPIHVCSEIGQLKKVMLHRPGYELENLMPEYIERLLFDDIPYLRIAQEEHDSFSDLLRKNGVEVLYLTDLTAESLTDEAVKNEFIREFNFEAGIRGERRTQMIADYFKEMSTKNMIAKMISGIRKSEIRGYGKKNLTDYLGGDYPFIIDPMPNLYFTRDPFSCIGNGVSIHHMKTVTRNRETLFAKYIFSYHPEYKSVPQMYSRSYESTLEGGDILILSDKVAAVGISQRTEPFSIELFAKNLFKSSDFNKVLAIDIPKSRSFMHLDTVFTMVDYNKFTVHNSIKDEFRCFVLEQDNYEKLRITEEHVTLDELLMEHLNLDKVELIKCGSGNIIDAAREQWNDGSNTFAVAPGKVIAYSRNYVTNGALQEHGVEVMTIPSSELSRGRGGPRCMTMPLVRNSL
ncbi:MAG: arginine deiminase [Bacillota bacterium]|nr:arginine deiminase [Bacillota bacterium]